MLSNDYRDEWKLRDVSNEVYNNTEDHAFILPKRSLVLSDEQEFSSIVETLHTYVVDFEGKVTPFSSERFSLVLPLVCVKCIKQKFHFPELRQKWETRAKNPVSTDWRKTKIEMQSNPLPSTRPLRRNWDDFGDKQSVPTSSNRSRICPIEFPNARIQSVVCFSVSIASCTDCL